MKTHSVSSRQSLKKINSFFKRNIGKISLISLGLVSTVWFLIRVIPKPSRATYPCMRTLAPIMSGFIIYLLSLSGSVLLFRNTKQLFAKKKYAIGILMLVIAVGVTITSNLLNPGSVNAAMAIEEVNPADLPANQPLGTAYGIDPGRVAWVFDKDATNQNCKNVSGDFWYQEKNNNFEVVEKMLADGIKKIALEDNVKDSWNALFIYHNNKLKRGNKGYTPGEKIYIKLNLVSSGKMFREVGERLDTSPYLIYAILRQLVAAGVKQEDIYIGDPYKSFKDFTYDMMKDELPNVNYMEGVGGQGRTATKISSKKEWFTSDLENNFSSELPQEYLDASYMVNIALFKTHDCGGITVGAKNHQGSPICAEHTPTYNLLSKELHFSYPNKKGKKGFGYYRHLVDYMGHEKLGGNTMLSIVDATWSAREAYGFVEKLHMEPFNNDFGNSIFLSQDQVAMESVCFDFMYYEYKTYSQHHDDTEWPLMNGVTDHIQQAASPTKWPKNFKYDPEDDGTAIGSLGVWEHWNDPSKKQYSKNLGKNYGIHLVSVPENLVETKWSGNPVSLNKTIASDFSLQIHPNPVSDFASIKYTLEEQSLVIAEIYSLNGTKIETLQSQNNHSGEHYLTWDITTKNIAPGNYICRLVVQNNKGSFNQTKKIIVN